MKSSLIVLCVGLCSSLSAYGESFKLFTESSSSENSGQPAPDYNERVKELKAGDVLEFSNGHKFKIGQLLGKGSATRIYELYDDPKHVLRIPSAWGSRGKNNKTYAEMHNAFLDGYSELRKLQVPTVTIQSSLRNEYAVVEKIPNFRRDKAYTLSAFQNLPNLANSEDKLLADALVEFAKKIAAFEEIGDGHSANIVWDPEKKTWLFMDWSHPHVLYIPSASESLDVGHEFKTWPANSSPEMKVLHAKLLDVIKARRLQWHARAVCGPAVEAIFSSMQPLK